MVTLEKAKSESNIRTWVSFLKTADIPVLRQTVRAVAKLKENREDVSPIEIASTVLNDPMMTFKVLTYAQNHKGKHQIQDLTQVEQAILMMGTKVFFNNISLEPQAEMMLKQDLSSLKNLLQLILRAHRSSFYAATFAAHLIDLHAEEVRVAALLHDLAETLLWCFNPEKMNTILQMQTADKQLRSRDAQEVVLGFKLADLQSEIIKAFKLPPLLKQLMDEEFSDGQRVKNVTLAVNLARHSAHGWDDAALPDDYSDIAKLLRVDVGRAKYYIGVPK